MKLIKPKVEILDELDGQAILERIEQIARTCYKSEPRYVRMSLDNTRWIWEDSEDFRFLGKEGITSYPIRVSATADKLVRRLIDSKHDAMLEFVDVTVKFTTDRAIANELVRHRMASYAQESTRYCNYSKDKFGNELIFIEPSQGVNDDWIEAMKQAEKAYLLLVADGWTAQQARAVLPLCTKTEINMKANLREWRHFFKLRCSKHAHPDMRVLALDLLKQMHKRVPIIFDDLYKEFYDGE